MDIHNSIMDIHNSIMDIHNYRVYALLAFHKTPQRKILHQGIEARHLKYDRHFAYDILHTTFLNPFCWKLLKFHQSLPPKIQLTVKCNKQVFVLKQWVGVK